jgi:hypothetical protein
LDDKEEYIEFRNTFFTNLKYCKIIELFNASMVHSESLNSKMLHYLNGNLINTYNPTINGKKINFTVQKKTGTNVYIYEDNFISKTISTIELTDSYEDPPAIASFKVDDENVFTKNANYYSLEMPGDFYLSCHNIDKIEISYENGKTFKTVSEDFDTLVNAFYVPCSVTPYRGDVALSGLKIYVEHASEYARMSALTELKLKDVEEVVYRLSVNSKPSQYDIVSLSCAGEQVLNYTFYTYINNYILFSGNSQLIEVWNNTDKQTRNEVMKLVDSKLYKNFVLFAVAEYKKMVAETLVKFITDNNYVIIVSDFKLMEA